MTQGLQQGGRGGGTVPLPICSHNCVFVPLPLLAPILRLQQPCGCKFTSTRAHRDAEFAHTSVVAERNQQKVAKPQTYVQDNLAVLLCNTVPPTLKSHRSTGQEKGEREERKTAAHLMSAPLQ